MIAKYLWILLWFPICGISAQCNETVFKINHGKLEKFSISGSYKGLVTEKVVDFDCDSQEIYVVKINGDVVRYSYSGQYKGLVTTKGNRIRVMGTILLITKNNVIHKFDISGRYLGAI